MKHKNRPIGLTIFLVWLFLANAFANDYFYTYRHNPIELKIVPQRLFVEFRQPQSPSAAKTVLRSILGTTFRLKTLNRDGKFQLLTLEQAGSSEDLQRYVRILRSDARIASASAVFRREGSRVLQAVNRTFVVRFDDRLSLQQISALNSRHNVLIVKPIFGNTFLLQTAQSDSLDGLQAANWYATLDGVRWAQPNFYYFDWQLLNATVNDPLWPQQWAHKNTGQTVASGAKSEFPQQVKGIPDADMDVDLAWDALEQNGGQAGGSADILVAMLDSGVDLDHPDLQDNLFSTGKDFSPDQGSDANDVQGHGTSTAGIVAAVGNNGIGVAGIAYNVKILPVKIFTTYGMADDADIAQAIDYAWQNGADILSDSWSGSTPNSVIDDAINRAKTQGRDGKGSVVVFSSGNEGHGTVSYPAYLDDVIAVGASNMFDEKKNPGSHDFQRNWGGNYGSALDLVAPTIVYSTDIAGSAGYDEGDYFDHFGGTSAACPQVAGVAALMLSANPALTADEVQNLLQKSADKIDRYAFDGNGWNEHVGHGRVNAYRAVLLALNRNGDAPLISHTPLQPTSDVSARTAVAFITDDDGLANDPQHEPALFYRTIFESDTSDWKKITDADGPSGDEYDFTIPAQSWGTEVQYYIRATDQSPDSLTSTFPSFGKSESVPPYLLHYFVGDFETRTFTSSDVPVSIADDNIYYTSTLSVDDDRPIVDLNATISISKHIEDLAVALEAPDSTASGIVSHNGEPGDAYSNTVLDDEATVRITDGSSPYSGSYKPDNALWVFDGLKGNGTWTLRAYDDTYYNNGGSIDGWSLDITYMKPVNPPVVSDIPDQTIDEGQQFAQFDLDDYVTDADNSDDEITWTYSGNKDLLVSIDPNTHVATVSTPDDDWNGAETIMFTATDPTLLADSNAATFTVNPVNDPPVVSDIPDQTIDEGQSFAQIHLDDYVSDPDNSDAEMTWTYSGNKDLTVSIDANRVATISVPDSNWNGSETITFTATDPGGLSDSDPATFTVNPVNDPPVVSDIPDQTIDEGQSFAQIHLDDYVSDPDNSDAEMTWTYSGNHDLTVSIDANRVATITAPDSNWNGSETITFTATDPGGLSDSDPATFTVNPVNDPPVVSDIPDQTIDEGQSFAQIHLDDYVSDPDNSDAEMTWTYSGNHDLTVTIDANRVATISAPDSNWNGSETITFTATDPGGLSDSDSATFTVNPVNDPPVITSEPDTTAVQGELYQYQVTATDADSGDVLHYRLLKAPAFLSIDSTTGLISGTPSNDDVGVHEVSVQVHDTSWATDTQTYQLTVKNQNDPPVVSDIPDQTIDEGQSFAPIHLDDYVSDPDNSDAEMTWTYSGNQDLTVTIDANRVATITAPDSNWNGSETITFTATDPGGLSDSDAATFTVNPVNDAPVITSVPDTTAVQGQLYQYQVTATDADSGDVLHYRLLKAPSFLSIDSTTGLISGTPSNNDVGVHEVSVQVHDTSWATDTQDYQLTVKNQNDPPVVSDIPDQTIDEGQRFAPIHLDDYVSDPDNSDAEMTWTYSGNQDLMVTIDANRVATITAPDSNWNGSETITFTATDPGGLSDSDSATFTVNPVNDAPVITSVPDTTAVQGELYQYQVTATDVDSGDVLHYRLLKAPAFLSIDSTTGLISGTPSNDDVGVHDVSVQVHDTSWATDTQNYQLTVKDQNDPPVVSDIPDQTIDEGQRFAPIHLDDYVSDPDNSDAEMTWTYSGNHDLTVTIDANRVATISAPDSNWNGSETITFTATDPGGLSDSDAATFTVKAVNDAPVITTPLPELSFDEDDSLFVSRQVWYPYVSDAETPDSLLHYTINPGRNVRVKALADGHLLWAPADWNGSDTLRLIVSDGQQSDSAQFRVTVRAINDAPQIVDFPDSLVFAQTDTLVLNLRSLARDADDPADSLYWSFASPDSQLRAVYDHAHQTLRLSAPGFVGYSRLFCTVRDGHGAVDRDTALVHVTDTGTALDDGPMQAIRSYRLEQNFPNPFNPVTTIRFSLKQNARVVLEIFALDGRKVATIADGPFPVGAHRLKVDLSRFSSGIYFYRLTVLQRGHVEFQRVRKMVLLK